MVALARPRRVMVEPSGEVHTTSNDVPFITSLTNMMEQVRDREPPIIVGPGVSNITVGSIIVRSKYLHIM